MSKAIATIQLAPGRVGFFDPLSRIHLTLGRPTAEVYSGTNCAALRRNVKAGVIRLISGTLGEDVPPFKVVEVNGKYKLAPNTAAEMAPVYAEKDKVPVQSEDAKKLQDAAEEEVRKKLSEIVAEVKGVEVEDGGDVKDAVFEKIKKDAEEPKKDETVEEDSKEVKKPAAKKKVAKKKAAAEE